MHSAIGMYHRPQIRNARSGEADGLSSVAISVKPDGPSELLIAGTRLLQICCRSARERHALLSSAMMGLAICFEIATRGSPVCHKLLTASDIYSADCRLAKSTKNSASLHMFVC